WQIFAITGSAFYLGLMGLAEFAPTLLLSLVAGAVADRYDRRHLIMLSQAAALLGSVALYLSTRTGTASLPLLYRVVVAAAAAAALQGPARPALLPTLVPRSLFPRAVTVHSTLQNLAWVSGPMLTGLVIAAVGVAPAYLLHAGLLLAALAAMTRVRAAG